MYVFLVLTLPTVYLVILLHIVWNVFKDTMKTVQEVVHNVQRIVHPVLMGHFVHNVITLFILLPLVNVLYVQYRVVSRVILRIIVLIVCNQCFRLQLGDVHFVLLLV